MPKHLAPTNPKGESPLKMSRPNSPTPDVNKSQLRPPQNEILPPSSAASFKGKEVDISCSQPVRKRLGLTTNLEKSGVKKLTLVSKTGTCVIAQDPAAFLNRTIATLSRAVRAIQARPPEPVPDSLQSLYTLCEVAVAAGPSTSQTLYDRIRIEIERKTGEIREVLYASEVVASREEDWLKQLETESKVFLKQMLLIRDIFLQLDRTYALQSPTLLSLLDLGLDLYRHSVIESVQLAPRITSALITVLNRDRDGDAISRPIVQSIINLLSTFSPQSNATLFVAPFTAASRVYYEQESARLSTQMKASDYLRQINKRYAEEVERAESVVGIELKADLMRTITDTMVVGYVERIAQKDLPTMVNEKTTEDLTSLYSLLGRTGADGLALLRGVFLQHMKDTGIAIIMDKDSDEQMVDNLINFRRNMLNIVKTSYCDNQQFSLAVSQAFEFFINKRENKPAEMMAKFLDAKLRSGNRAMNDSDLEDALNDVLFLFRFTQGKDIFEAFYKRDLAKRLLLNKSASFDAERSMLLKLKDECGAGFTQKLEVMFKDIELSSDVMRAYHVTPGAKEGFELSVNVLSMGNWPTYPAENVRIPASMTKSLEMFKGFYVSKHSGRTLTWQHSLDHCALKAVFPKGGKKELAVSLYQALVLLLFNEVAEGGRLSFEEIVEAVRFDKKEAARTLQSLACGKVRVLQKVPKGKEVLAGDHFSFNTDFKHDHVKVKINQIQQKETAEENKSTTDRVFTDRASHLQLAIVRIMKARKTLNHSELVMEVITQIGQRFKVETSEIKKSISSLIDREYMRRADDQKNVYEYVA